MNFSRSDTNVLYLHNYYSVRYKEHAGISEKILSFKGGDERAIDFFATEMIAAMDVYYAGHMDYLSNMLVCIMPSHEKGKYSPGLVTLARRISGKYGMKCTIFLIQRTKTHERKSQGGNRDIDVMLDSLSINPAIDIKGKNILVLDDVTTSGNSINAVRKLLKDNGAGQIIPQTLGRTQDGTYKIDYIIDFPDFSINIETEIPKVSRDINGAKTILKRYFGYDSFKQGQTEIIDTILSGRDALAIMPTGAGKSICYQIPALMMDGITIVISPLISLMQDQVKALNNAGVHAAFINSSLNDRQITAVLQRAQRGEYKIIYVAPERLENSGFISLSKDLRISMISVDEAHCISQWGQDFRPSYLKITKFIKTLKTRPIVSAFTATATEEVKEDIITTLNLNAPKVVITGFNRENLYFMVETGVVKDEYILEYINKHPGESGIIYCSTRKNVENLFELLFRAGIPVTRYHAGLDSVERKNNQDDFIYDKVPIIVATNAFGMGIDKSNVRFVIHYNMPQSMENYYQEAGRAGRDGERSDCIMLFSPQDVLTQKWLLDHKEFADIDPEDVDLIRERDAKRLHIIENYCKTTGCLREYILGYFGETITGPCDNCGNCHREYKELDMTAEAKCVANCIYETRGKYGLTIVSGTLVGANRARVREVGADKYKTYGSLKALGEPMIKRLITQMIQDEYLTQTDERYSVIEYGSRINQLKDPETRVYVRYYDEKEIRKSKTSEPKLRSKDELTSAGYDLFEKLRALRLQIAREEVMPPYIIFNDRTLIQMCILLPGNKEEMLRVSGVGDAKYEKYGERFIEEIQEFLDERPEDITRLDADDDSYLEPVKSRKRKREKKEDFYISPEDMDRFEYLDLYTVREIRSELNRITTADNVRKCTYKKIWEFLFTSGYVTEEQVDGVWSKIPTEIGLLRGITIKERISEMGFHFKSLLFPPDIQREVVESFISVDNTQMKEESDSSDKSEKTFDRADYNRKKNKPEGAGAAWTQEEDEQLENEYKDGLTISDIAKIHKRTRGGIRARLKKHGLVE